MGSAWSDHLLASLGLSVLGNGPLRAGVFPAREDIAAWVEQLSFDQIWRSAQEQALQQPYGVRLAAGAALAILGALLIVGSFRRAMRPTQADLVRRVANAAHSDQAESDPRQVEGSPPGAKGNEPPSAAPTAAGPVPVVPPVAAESVAPRRMPDPPLSPARSSPQTTASMAPRAFFTAEEFGHGDAPWAVPLGHDLVRIGRHQENDIRLEDKTVHRYHALLHRSPDGDFLIRDLSGLNGNGVYVNGARIEQAALRPGDLVELGAVRLRFQQQRPS